MAAFGMKREEMRSHLMYLVMLHVHFLIYVITLASTRYARHGTVAARGMFLKHLATGIGHRHRQDADKGRGRKTGKGANEEKSKITGTGTGTENGESNGKSNGTKAVADAKACPGRKTSEGVLKTGMFAASFGAKTDEGEDKLEGKMGGGSEGKMGENEGKMEMHRGQGGREGGGGTGGTYGQGQSLKVGEAIDHIQSTSSSSSRDMASFMEAVLRAANGPANGISTNTGSNTDSTGTDTDTANERALTASGKELPSSMSSVVVAATASSFRRPSKDKKKKKKKEAKSTLGESLLAEALLVLSPGVLRNLASNDRLFNALRTRRGGDEKGKQTAFAGMSERGAELRALHPHSLFPNASNPHRGANFESLDSSIRRSQTQFTQGRASPTSPNSTSPSCPVERAQTFNDSVLLMKALNDDHDDDEVRAAEVRTGVSHSLFYTESTIAWLCLVGMIPTCAAQDYFWVRNHFLYEVSAFPAADTGFFSSFPRLGRVGFRGI